MSRGNLWILDPVLPRHMSGKNAVFKEVFMDKEYLAIPKLHPSECARRQKEIFCCRARNGSLSNSNIFVTVYSE